MHHGEWLALRILVSKYLTATMIMSTFLVIDNRVKQLWFRSSCRTYRFWINFNPNLMLTLKTFIPPHPYLTRTPRVVDSFNPFSSFFICASHLCANSSITQTIVRSRFFSLSPVRRILLLFDVPIFITSCQSSQFSISANLFLVFSYELAVLPIVLAIPKFWRREDAYFGSQLRKFQITSHKSAKLSIYG